MKRLILALALVLLSFTAIATAHPPNHECDCEYCAEFPDKACEDLSIPFIYICNDYTAEVCPS